MIKRNTVCLDFYIDVRGHSFIVPYLHLLYIEYKNIDTWKEIERERNQIHR